MHNWNVIITVHEGGFVAACELLEQYGRISKTGFFNVLVMRTDDPRELMEWLKAQFEANPAIGSFLNRLIPVEHVFSFQTTADFRIKIIPIVEPYISRLMDKTFYVRMHRRGFKGRLSSMEEERWLDGYLHECILKAGGDGRISFENPDAVLSVETIAQHVGVGLWLRDDIDRYPFLRFD
ncbi:THUMP domain-containing protein [Desulfococcus multivorans]|uniref:THUMP domain-containing protein n=1 Tax=Desulfococcus multivorans DSM 2059 TaxID=1121405 RepID=S7UH66_DESML|nr:THUMP domain-containing protein [Desulfococcus multivorans]AQV01880.1 hypothetical protein B2D07_14650 [Desulfococcus multivorans]EPR33184.1 THUMP domain-containing protein [Desulfococcus multivorans DSM 2059]SKA24092.1 tRNA(Ser,Leu) C12 N-acetylase TAN1, contains THUMP domain [Desulfococcus multivorans DSM 2059]